MAGRGRTGTPGWIRPTVRRPQAAVMMLLVGIGCSDDPAQPPAPEGLSPAEVQGLVDGLAAAHAFDLDFGDQDPWPCPRGGSVTPSLFTAMGAESIVTNGSLTLNGCRVGSPSGNEFTLGGTVSVSHDVSLDEFGQVTGAEGTVAGNVDWSLPGRSGRCVLDLSSASTASGIRVQGSACGRSVDRLIG